MDKKDIKIRALMFWAGSTVPIPWDDVKNLKIGFESFEAPGDPVPVEIRSLPKGCEALSVSARSLAGTGSKHCLLLCGEIYNRKVTARSEFFELADYEEGKDAPPVRFFLMLNTALSAVKFG